MGSSFDRINMANPTIKFLNVKRDRCICGLHCIGLSWTERFLPDTQASRITRRRKDRVGSNFTHCEDVGGQHRCFKPDLEISLVITTEFCTTSPCSVPVARACASIPGPSSDLRSAAAAPALPRRRSIPRPKFSPILKNPTPGSGCFRVESANPYKAV